MALYHYAVKMSKMAEIWGFVPYSVLKMQKAADFCGFAGEKHSVGR